MTAGPEGGEHKIIVGVDGSRHSVAALRWGAVQAAALSARLEAVNAWEYPASFGWSAVPSDWDPARDMEKVLQDAVRGPSATVAGGGLELSVREGGAARVLLEAARGATMLVVGSRGHGGFAGLLLGSVSANVAEHARCPVLVIFTATGRRRRYRPAADSQRLRRPLPLPARPGGCEAEAMYELLFSLLLRRMGAEAAHRLGFGLIRAAALIPGAGWLLRRWLAPADPVLRVRALGRDLPGPLGLAAGFDKDAVAPDALGALGFAFVEVGTVTAARQPGNPKPRLFRLPADRALINRMGFNNHGAAAAARLRARRGRGLAVGANIGKTKAVPDAGAVADYAESARLLAGTADYLVVNVSSPNTPGLRDLQAARPAPSPDRRPRRAGGARPPPGAAARQDRPGPGRRRRRRDRRPGPRPGPGRRHRHQHHRLPRPPGQRPGADRRGRARRPVGPAATGAFPCTCCGGCAPAPATACCWSHPAGSRPPTTRGSGSGPAPRCYRPTPDSSTAARSGRAASSPAWPAGSGKAGFTTIQQAVGADLSRPETWALPILWREGRVLQGRE